MKAKSDGLFFGGQGPDGWSKGLKKLFGKGVGKITHKSKHVLNKFEEATAAREVMQFLKGSERREEAPMPAKCMKELPKKSTSTQMVV